MAKAVAPIELETAGAWRWHVRTDSIRDTNEALSGLWGRVAQQADSSESHPGDTAAAIGRGEPRLASHLAIDEYGVRVRTRTSVLTLVVLAPRPELVERAMAAVSTLASRHPSRAIVISSNVALMKLACNP